MVEPLSKRFALIGAAGFVAPRHMKAIRENGHELVAAYDPHDSVGVMDSWSPKADFFTEFERFDRHLDLCRRANAGVDYLSICSPNYLHDAHIRLGLRNGADVICEKPLVLNPWNVLALETVAGETGHQVWNILQLRLHPAIIALKNRYTPLTTANDQPTTKVDIDLSYITSRGHWYYSSWKGDVSKSGGIATNIGIHFFDMLMWIFGDVQVNTIHILTHDRAAGFLELERARVRWFLSIQSETLPAVVREKGGRTWRSLSVDGEEIEFSDGFTDLHTEAYKSILDGRGFPLMEAMPSVQLVHDIRHQTPSGLVGEYHPLARLPLTRHPFDLDRRNEGRDRH